jgi:hypothetical protein
MRRWLPVLLISGVLAGCGGGSDELPAPAPEPGPMPGRALTLTIDQVRERDRLGDDVPAAGAKFLLFDVTIASRGVEEDLLANNFSVVGDDRVVYDRIDATFGLEDGCTIGRTVRPDTRLSCQVAVEVDAALRGGTLFYDSFEHGDASADFALP